MPTRMAALLSLVLMAGCTVESSPISGETTPSSTSSPDRSTTGSTLPITTTSNAPPTTTTAVFLPTEFECPPVLVTGETPVRIDEECSVVPLGIEQVVDLAEPSIMDDLAGGLLWQADQRVIRWRGVGSAGPVEPVTAGGGESVTLQDVVRVGDETEIWFTRQSGFTIDDAVQTLERSALDGGEPTLVKETGGWESSSDVTVGGQVIAFESGAEGFYSFGITDLVWSAVEWASQAWNPFSELESHDMGSGCDRCPIGLVVSDDGRTVGYLSSSEDGAGEAMVIVVDLDSGEESRYLVPGLNAPNQFSVAGLFVIDLDLLGSLALVNTADDLGGQMPARWADLSDDDPTWTELPFRGHARFLRSDVRIGETEKG